MPLTVLVADDSPTIQNKAKGILTGEGLEVVTVSNGVAAIKKLSQIKPQLILADVAMPGRDGYEVCDFVKNSPDHRDVTVLLIFSDADPYNEEQGARVRADGTIRKMAAGKPFIPEELISTVTKYLSKAGRPAPAESTALGPDRTVVTEPVDAEPEVRTRKSLDLGSLPPGSAFSELQAEEPPSFNSEPSPAASEPVWPVVSPPEASTRLGPDAGADREQTAEALPAEEFEAGSEPMLIEEPPEPPSAAHDLPESERTMLFSRPADIAQPRFNDELSPPAPPPDMPPADTGEEEGPVAATTLESFSLNDATSGEVRFASHYSDSFDGAAETTPALDSALVQSIVQKVVARMSPPALSPHAIEEMAQRLADEIIAEINSERS